MKRNILLSILILYLFSNSTYAQYHRASFWEKDMKEFAQQDATNGISQKSILFAGSSSIKMWRSLEKDFPKHKVLNRGFGGSCMTDVIYFFNEVIKPYAPSQVVLYEGDNDLINPDKTPESFMNDVITITRMIHIHFPKTNIVLISIKPSPSRLKASGKYQIANNLMKNFAKTKSYITYVNIWDDMLNEEGLPNKNLYMEDMLHMNRKGYDIWKQILTPYLIMPCE